MFRVFKYFYVRFIICLRFLVIVNLQYIPTENQHILKAVQACTEYKKELFEFKQTFGFLVRDSPEFQIVVDKCTHYDPFVVGGIPASPKEFPPMARIGHYENGTTNWFCGGTLISKKYVLTAAHCFYSIYNNVNRVRLGELNFNQTNEDASPEDFSVKQLIKHPDYSDDVSLYNDIALIELDREAVFDSFKHPACLPITDGNEFQEFIATGWGDTRFGGSPSEQLLKVKLNRFDNVACKKIAKRIGTQSLAKGLNIRSQMCAASAMVRDTCNGDSGGPLFAYHEQYPCLYYVVGVTSAGIENCGQPNVPGIYTRVYYFMDWIKSYVFN